MPDIIACPHCGQRYPYLPHLAGRPAKCRKCGQAFRMPTRPATPTSPTPSPMAGSTSKSPGAPSSDPWHNDLLDDLSLPAEALQPPGGPPRRRTRMSARDKPLLVMGIAAAGCAWVVLVLLAVLGIASSLAVAAGFTVGLAGAVLAAVALRRNPLAAGAAGIGLFCVLVVTALVRPGASGVAPDASATGQGTSGSAWGRLFGGPAAPPTIPQLPGETSQNPVDQMTALVHLAESIRDQGSFREAGPRILKLFGGMLQGESDGWPAAPDKRSQIEEALPQFDQRMAAASQRLDGIAGGMDLERKLIELVQAARKIDVPSLPKPDRKQGDLLSAFQRAYYEFCLKNGKAPDSWETLEASLNGSPAALAAVRQLRSKNPVVHWGLSLSDFAGQANFVLAYEKQAAGQGGEVAMVGGVRWVRADALREQLNAQSAIVEKATGVAPPKWPTWEDEIGRLPTIGSWVVWGWATPPPPEPAKIRQQRQDALKAAGSRTDLAVVYVEGITSDSMAARVGQKIIEITQGTMIAPIRTDEIREFRCTNVADLRAMAHRLDVGPIVEIEEAKGVLHVRLDRTKLFVRSKAPVAGPLPPIQTSPGGSQVAEGLKLPAPPEPPEVRQQRENVRWDAGENLDGVELLLHGSNDELNKLAFERLGVMKVAKKLRWATPNGVAASAAEPSILHCDDVGDMRVFAAKLDFGSIIQYDDQKGVIGVVVDAARLAVPLEPEAVPVPKAPEPDDVRERRRDARQLAGLPQDAIDLLVKGFGRDQARTAYHRLLALRRGSGVEWRMYGNGGWQFRVEPVKDMRAFAAKVDLGKIIEYDEEAGRIVIQGDAAKLAAPLPPPDPDAPVTEESSEPSDFPGPPGFGPRRFPWRSRFGP